MEEEKAFIVDKLYKRDAERVELLQKQHKLKEDVNASNEQLDYFSKIFNEKVNKIETALKITNTCQSSQLTSHFDSIRNDVRDLQKYLAASSLFLKDYNIRKSQDIVQDLQARSLDLENSFFPKKKFGFRNKKQNNKKLLNNDEVDNIVSDARESEIVKEVKHNKIDVEKKKSWDVVTCGFVNITNEKLSLECDDVHKKDVSLRCLTNCVIIIMGSPATLHLDHLNNCVVLCGPVSSSIFVDRCINNKMALACQQLRFHSSINCDVYLHVTSKAIIEDCSNIKVAPYNFKYADIEKDFEKSHLDINVNNWNKLDDFNWLVSDVSSPNWKVLSEDMRINMWDVDMNNTQYA